MSKKAILFVTGCLTLLSGPAFAGDTGINIIYPPPRETTAAEAEQPTAKALKQTVTVTVVTVAANQSFAGEYWYPIRRDDRWTSGSRTSWRYYRPGYPF